MDRFGGCGYCHVHVLVLEACSRLPIRQNARTYQAPSIEPVVTSPYIIL